MTHPKLNGTVGPGFTISLKSAVGKRVTAVGPGTYTFVVADKSGIHNFHLSGPGVNKALTTIGGTGTKTVTLALKAGTYRYYCEAHPTIMKGSFKVSLQ